MEHNRKKTGQALYWIAAGLALFVLFNFLPVMVLLQQLFGSLFALLPFSLMISLPLLVGCILAYRRSGAGGYAVAAVFAGLLTLSSAASLFPLELSVMASNIWGLFQALTICLTLFFLLNATAEVLRVSREEDLAKKLTLPKILVLIDAALSCFDFVAVTAHLPFSIPAAYILYIFPVIYLIVFIFVLKSARRLVKIQEIDETQLDEIRSRLQ